MYFVLLITSYIAITGLFQCITVNYYICICACNVILVLVNAMLCCSIVMLCNAIDASLLHQLMSHGWMHTDTHKDWVLGSRSTLTMFVEVVALRYQHHITECHNSHKHSRSPLTRCQKACITRCFMLLKPPDITSCFLSAVLFKYNGFVYTPLYVGYILNTYID